MKLPVKVAAELSNLINQMMVGDGARKLALERGNQSDYEYWYNYQLRAERALQDMGIHLASPLE